MRTTENMRKIALFGGAFDPPTKSHLKVARSLLKLVDEVWLMPCYVSYYDKKMAPAEDRIRMCQLATQEYPTIRVSSFEIANKLKGETYEIMEHFLNSHGGDDQFYFVIGQDNANKMHTWGGFDRLTNMVPFLVVPRMGYEPDPLITWYRQPPHIFFEDLVPNDGSSTQVRNEFAEKRSSDLVTDAIAKYILDSGFYV